MKKVFSAILLLSSIALNVLGQASSTPKSMKYIGVVYDVGLQFQKGWYSVNGFDSALVAYDMHAIANDMHANTVRIEGEDIDRLVKASRLAHANGLSIFFNPWKMGGDSAEVRKYFIDAAKAAEKLRKEGIDLVFVAGCEYSIFCKDVFPGDTFEARLAWLVKQATAAGHMSSKVPAFRERSVKLNKFLRSFCNAIRKHYTGPVTYSAGTWESVDWSLFDIVGIDYYRQGETEKEYLAGLENYKIGKPVVVMEVGSCTYEGAAAKGAGGFAIRKGTNADGTMIFEGGVIPQRSEKEQADYVETQINILSSADIQGAFVYVFSFPSSPVGEGNKDYDMVSFSLVKTFPPGEKRSKNMPPWEAKDAFYRLAKTYENLAKTARE